MGFILGNEVYNPWNFASNEFDIGHLIFISDSLAFKLYWEVSVYLFSGSIHVQRTSSSDCPIFFRISWLYDPFPYPTSCLKGFFFSSNNLIVWWLRKKEKENWYFGDTPVNFSPPPPQHTHTHTPYLLPFRYDSKVGP